MAKLTLGQRIERARLAAGFMSPERAACKATRARVGLTGRELRKWEAAEPGREEPTARKLRAICLHFNCSASELLDLPA